MVATLEMLHAGRTPTFSPGCPHRGFEDPLAASRTAPEALQRRICYDHAAGLHER